MSKVRNLPETTTLADNDLLYAVDDAAGPNGGRKITKANLKTSVAQSPAEIKTAYESNPNTNAYTDAEKSKLAGIEPGATADQIASEVPYNNSISGISATNVQDALDQIDHLADADFKATIVSGLIVHYTGGTARFDGVFTAISAADILLNANITNGSLYVDTDGFVKQTASNTPAPPYTIVFAQFSTNLTNITSLSDRRVKNAQNLIRSLVSDITDINAGDTAYQGDTERVADAGHQHAVLTATAVTLDATTTNTEGTSTELARANHTHDISTGTVSTQTPDQANAEGSSANLARADHIHDIPTATAVGLDTTSTSTQGSNASFARSNHTHAIASGAASTQTPDQSNAAGSSANFAKADHVHNIPTATPTDIGSTNTQGSASSFARSDHIHKGLHSLKANAGTQRFGDTSLVNGNGVSVTDDGSGNFTIDTNFGANEFVITSFSGLTINYNGGRFVNGLNGTVFNVPAGSIAVSPSLNPGYLYISLNMLSSTPTVTSSATPPPFDSLPIASFVSGSSAVLTTTDIRSFVNISPLGNILRVTYPGSGLVVSYNAGRVRINGTVTNITDGTLTLSANIATGAIYVDTDNTVKSNTTGVLPPNSVPLALYTTGPSTVTALTGQRSFLNNYVVFGASGDIVTIVPNASAAAGATNKYADAGHTHAIATATAVGLDSTSTSTEGNATSFARSNHTHAIASGAASTQTPNNANAAGVSANFAKADHVHNIPTGTPSTLNATNSNTQGSAAAFAQQDHLHAISTGIPSTQTPDQTNTTGTSANLARADHIHNIPSATVGTVSTNSTNTHGTAASFALSDHIHQVTVASQEATATVDDTTTSATDVLMNSMTQTPVAGTYLVMWSGSIVNSANGAERTWVSLYLNGSQVSATERSIGASGGAYEPAQTFAIITTPGSQAIELRWRVAGGTSTVHSRRLSLLRIS